MVAGQRAKVSLFHELPLGKEVSWCRAQYLVVRLNCPGRFLEQLVRTNRLGRHVDYPGIGRAEITGHVAAILLQLPIHVDDFKVTDLVVRGDEMLTKILTNTWI